MSANTESSTNVLPSSPPQPHVPEEVRTEVNVSAEESISISWENLSYTVGKRLILRGLTGRAIPGRSLAILGSSGAGKTTLLNALAGRLAYGHEKVLSGDVRLNDAPYERQYSRLLGFVPQEDILGAMSTPESALNFTIRLRLGVSKPHAKAATDAMIEKLKLPDCRNTIVGIPGVIQGLSGGERKRLNIGVELIADTKLLLCDEPTSGLDSTTSLMVAKTLREIAHRDNRSVLFTVHQPTRAMTRHFDDILLLTNGYTVYHGPMERANAYFAAIGFPCPPNYTPTDHYMLLLQDPSISAVLVDNWRRFLALNNIAQCENATKAGGEGEMVAVPPPTADRSTGADGGNAPSTDPTSLAPVETDEYLPSYVREQKAKYSRCSDAILKSIDLGPDGLLNSIAFPAASNLSSSPTASHLKMTLSNIKPSLLIQWEELLKRCWQFVYTNKPFVAITVMQTVIFSLIAGLLFLNLQNSITGIQDRLGLFFIVIFASSLNNATGTINRFKPLRELYIREQQSGIYSPTIYWICSFLVDIPLFGAVIMLQTIIVYFMTDLHRSAENFFTFFAVLFFLCQVGLSVGYALSTLISNSMVATAAIPCAIIPLMLCGGLLADNEQIRPYWYWLEKLSFIRSGFLLLVHLELPTLHSLSCDSAQFGSSCAMQPKSGDQFIEYKGFDGDQDQSWCMWLQLALCFVLLRALHLLGLQITARTKF